MSKNRSTAKKVRNILFIAIALSVAIVPAVLTSKFGYGFSPILTGSMQPAANPGDVFLTRLAPATALSVGDVIAVNNQTTGVYYSHRIVEIRDFNGALRIITKGDANKSADRDPFIVSPYAKVSLVVKTIPYVGRPMVYMNTVQGRQTAASFLVVANLLGLFAFLFRKKIVASLTPERVYRELYIEERRNTEQYRELIDNLQEALAIEREQREGREQLMNPMTSALSKGAGSVALKITIVVAAAVGGAGMVASNVFAALTATATNTSGGSVTTGTLKLEYAAAGASGGFATAIDALAPGDTVNRYIDLSVTGTLDGETPTVQLASADSNTLVNDGSKGLQVTISACSVAWTQSGAGTCSGTTTSVLGTTSALALKSSASSITLPSTLAAGVNRLKLSISLPSGSENTVNGVLPGGTVQGLNASLTWSFIIQERTARNTSS